MRLAIILLTCVTYAYIIINSVRGEEHSTSPNVTFSSIEHLNTDQCTIQEFKRLYVICNAFHEDTGKYIDKLIHQSLMENRKVSLCFIQAQFPNETFTMSKYIGKYNIDEIMFSNCSFKRLSVESRFWSLSLAEIRRLHISDMNLDSIDLDVFSLYSHIQELMFSHVNVKHFDGNFLSGKESILERLHFIWLPSEYSLNDIFNSTSTTWIIYYLVIASFSPKFHLISAANFSKLTALEHLDLSDCGIAIIEDDAFRFIIKTLQTIYLQRNRIKQIVSSTFYGLFDSKMKTILLTVRMDQMKCHCDLAEFKAIANTIFEHHNMRLGYALIEIGCVEKDDDIDYHRDCAKLQTITRFCSTNNFARKFQYPQFDLKWDVSTNSLMIKAYKQRIFRVWIHRMISLTEFNNKWGYTDTRCPKNGYLQTYLSCFLLNATNVTIELDALTGDYKNIRVCIIYVWMGPRTMWPLHCITLLNKSIETDVEEFVYIAVMLLMSSSLIGLCLSMILIRPVFKQVMKVIDQPQYDNAMSEYRAHCNNQIHITRRFEEHDSKLHCHEVDDYESIGFHNEYQSGIFPKNPELCNMPPSSKITEVEVVYATPMKKKRI